MSIPEDSDLELEIAHVLLIDVVGYSKLLVNGQIETLQQLNRIVRETAHFRSAEAKGKLMRLPTGDGMALLFFDSAEAPLQCALEISEAGKACPQMQLRMGAHSGPIKEVMDVNERPNFAGAGINLAQRVLDCGDAGHILVSQRLAEDLRSYRHWHSWLHDLGECEVKHGVQLHLYNLCKDDLGNPAIPAAISRQRGRWQRWKKSTTRWLAGSLRRKAALSAGVAVIIIALAAAGWFGLFRSTIAQRPTTNAEAYNLYLRARDLIQGSVSSARAKTDLTKAAQLLKEAVESDPDFFLAHYYLAQAYDQLYRRFDQSEVTLALVETTIQTLHRLQPEAGETHLASAWHLYLARQDNNRARAELEIAQRHLPPNESEIPLLYGYIDRREGRWDDSIHHLRRALELDPRNPLILQQLSLTYFYLRRFPEMAEALDLAITLDPSNLAFRAQRAGAELEWQGNPKPLHALIDSAVRSDPSGAATIVDHWIDLAIYERDDAAFTRALNFLSDKGYPVERVPFPRSWYEGMAAHLRGDHDAARAAFMTTRAEVEAQLRDHPDDSGLACTLGLVHAFLGNQAEAIANGKRALELLPANKDAIDEPLLIGYLAVIYAWTGEKDLALEHLERATKVPSSWSYGNLRLHPYWDPLRGDARFEAIVETLASK